MRMKGGQSALLGQNVSCPSALGSPLHVGQPLQNNCIHHCALQAPQQDVGTLSTVGDIFLTVDYIIAIGHGPQDVFETTVQSPKHAEQSHDP